jgi:hypothetical protein
MSWQVRRRKSCTGPILYMSLTFLKLRISEKYRNAKEKWHEDPTHHGSEEISPPPTKKSCLDRAKNGIARTAAQIRTGHWRSSVYLKRIRKRQDDKCWFCRRRNRMTSFTLSQRRAKATREKAWEGKEGGVRVLLANPRWEKRLLRFLKLSGVWRVMDDGEDEEEARAARLDGCIIWETKEREPLRGPVVQPQAKLQ